MQRFTLLHDTVSILDPYYKITFFLFGVTNYCKLHMISDIRVHSTYEKISFIKESHSLKAPAIVCLFKEKNPWNCLTNNPRARKKLEFQLAFGTSISQILLALGKIIVWSFNELVGRWLAWSQLAHQVMRGKRYLPRRRIYLSRTTEWHFFWALTHAYFNCRCCGLAVEEPSLFFTMIMQKTSCVYSGGPRNSFW